MTGLIRLLFLVFFVFILRLVFHKLVHWKAVQKRARRRVVNEPGGKTISGRMVKDPQCGTYVASELAIPLRTGGGTLHFCSQNCLEEFRRLHPARGARVSVGHS